jgi:hypothetical protein
MIRAATVRVTTVGSNGAAVGTAYSASPLNGELLALVVDWHASAPGTSDITVSVEADGEFPAVTLYAKTDAATDVTVYPRVQVATTAGVAIDAVYDRIPVVGRLKIAIAGCNALTNAAVVTAYVRD